MKHLLIATAVAALAFVAACASPQDKAAKADAQMTEKRMQLADEYKQCTEYAAAFVNAQEEGTADRVPPDRQMTKEDCEEIMKMMEALK
jgi:hypothetical protein